MSTILLSDRASTTLKEQLIPQLQDNFWRLSRQPVLRLLGMEKNEAPGKGSGTPVHPRISKITSFDHSYQFQVVHRHTAQGGGIYGAAENEALKDGRFYAARSTVPAKYIQGSFKLTLQSIVGTRDKKASLANEIVENAVGSVHRMHKNMNGMLVGKAHALGAQALCIVNGAVSADTTVVVDNGGTSENPSTKDLHQGDLLTIGTAAEILAGTGVDCEVASVTDNVTFETTANVTLADNDIVVRRSVYDSTNSVFKELHGLDSLIANTGTVQGVNKATNQWFQSQITAVGGDLTVNKILLNIAACRRYSKNPQNLILVGNTYQFLRYSGLLTSTKSYDADKFAGNLAGGIQGLTVYSPDGALPFFLDDDVPDGQIYVIDPDGYTWGEMMPFDFVPDNLSMGGYPATRETGYARYEFAFMMMGNLAQVNARSSGKLTGITGPTV